MTDNKKTKRSISKPRLLKATLGVMETYNISEQDAVGELIKAMEQEILTDAMNKA